MSNQILTLEQIREKAPAVFELEPSKNMNIDKYKIIHTKDILEPLSDKGWFVYDASQRTTRKDNWKDKTFHVLRFRNNSLYIGNDPVEIVISNSHNGTSSFKIQIGIYRLVCSNGLIVGDDLVSPLYMSHKGLTSDFIAELVTLYADTMFKNVYTQVSRMNNFKIYSDEIKIDFAKKASLLKHNEDILVNTRELIEPTRRADESNNLWTLYNVVQNHLMLGDYSIKTKNRDWRKARKVSSTYSDITINNKLFNLALEYVS